MLIVVMDFDSSARPPSVTMVDHVFLRNSDLPDVAARLVRLMPGATRVRIFEEGVDTPFADTGEQPAIGKTG